jgi:hypothetical protein
MSEWRTEDQQVKLTIGGLAGAETSDSALDARRMFELANKADSQYSAERAKLLRMICWNISVDAASATPACRYPVDLIFQKGKLEEWSALVDDLRTFHAPATAK